MLRLRKTILLLVFLMVIVVMYSPSINARFVFDFIDWHNTYSKMGIKGLFSSFNDPSLHYGYHLVFFSFVNCFGQNQYLWFFAFCGLHATNTWLLYLWINRLTTAYNFKQSSIIAFLSALLFTLSPFHTEVIVWGATVHYLVATTLSLIILLLTTKSPNRIKSMLIVLLFGVSLFVHEFTLTLPFIILLLSFMSIKSIPLFRNYIQTFFVPFCTVIIGYFLLNKWLLGQWIGHYGAETHLSFNLHELSIALLRYLAKYLVFAPFVPAPITTWLYSYNQPVLILSGLLIFILCVYYFVVPIRNKILLGIALTGAYVIAITPSLNLYFPYWVNIHADRLGYFPSLFLYGFIGIFSYLIAKQYSKYLLTGLLFFSFFTLSKNIVSWQNASTIIQRLEQSYPVDSTVNTYLLNVPDNFDGAYMFRCLGESKFATTYKLHQHTDLSPYVIDVLGYNMYNMTDGASASVIDSVTLEVTLTNPKGWYWRYTLGAESYETEAYIVELNTQKNSYRFHLKNKQPTDRFLLQNGPEWQILNAF
jgi:hypothetical protein